MECDDAEFDDVENELSGRFVRRESTPVIGRVSVLGSVDSEPRGTDHWQRVGVCTPWGGLIAASAKLTPAHIEFRSPSLGILVG